jgi:branched-chain amino acid transport system substrate-binding protein
VRNPFLRRRFLQAAGGVGAAGLLAACSSSSGTSAVAKSASGKFDQTLLWGIFLPTSGPFVSVSQPWITATQLAFNQINASGGIKVKGKQVGFTTGVYNTQYAAGPALIQFRNFVSDGGHYLSGLISVEEGVAVQGLNVRNNVFVAQEVSGASTQLTPNKLRLFVGLDNTVGYTPVADYAHSKLSATKIASIELDNDWGHSIYTAVQKRFGQLGGEWTDRQYMQATDTDFTGPLTSMLRGKPDVLAIIIGNGAGELIVKQARSFGWKGPMILIGAWDANAVPGAGAGNLTQCVGVGNYPSVYQNASLQKLRTQIYDKTKQIGDTGFSAPDPVKTAVTAMELAQSLEPMDVMEAIPDAIKKNLGTYLNGWTGAFATKNHGVYVQLPGYVATMDPTVDAQTAPVWQAVSGTTYAGYPCGTPKSLLPDVIA